MIVQKLLILIGLLFTLPNCGSEPEQESGQNNPLVSQHSLTSTPPPQSTGILLLAGGISYERLADQAERPLRELKQNLESAGYENVDILPYDNSLRTPRLEIEQSALENIRAHIVGQPNRTYTLIGHSMGHYVALAAVLRGNLASKIDRVIGIAGAAHGGEGAPIGCGAVFGRRRAEERCPGIEGMIQESDTYILDDFYEDHRATLDTLDLCAIASSKDRILRPRDSGFMPGGKNFSVDFGGHMNLPKKEALVAYMRESCGL